MMADASSVTSLNPGCEIKFKQLSIDSSNASSNQCSILAKQLVVVLLSDSVKTGFHSNAVEHAEPLGI